MMLRSWREKANLRGATWTQIIFKIDLAFLNMFHRKLINLSMRTMTIMKVLTVPNQLYMCKRVRWKSTWNEENITRILNSNRYLPRTSSSIRRWSRPHRRSPPNWTRGARSSLDAGMENGSTRTRNIHSALFIAHAISSARGTKERAGWRDSSSYFSQSFFSGFMPPFSSLGRDKIR